MESLSNDIKSTSHNLTSTPTSPNFNSNSPNAAMKSQKGGLNAEENVTPAPVTSPALPVEEDEVRDLDLSSFIEITDHEVLFQSKGNFRCKCNAKFKNLPLLKLHIRTRVEKPRFKCHPCNLVFFFESQLKKHQKSKKCGQKTANYVAGPSSGSNGNGVGTSLESGQDQLLDPTPVSASSSSSDQLPQTKQATEKGKETDPIRRGLLREVQNGNSIESKAARELVICLTRLDMSSLPPPRMSPRHDEMPPQNSNHTTPPHHSKIEVEEQSVTVVTQKEVVNPDISDEEERQNDSSCSSNQHSSDDDQIKSKKCTQITGPSESNGNGVGTCSETDDELVDLVPISASSSDQLLQTKRAKMKGKGRNRRSRRKFPSRKSFLREVQNGRSIKSKRKRTPMVLLARYLRKSLRRIMSPRRLGVPPQTSKQHSSDIQMKSKKWRQMSANYIAAPSESNGNGVGTCSGILDQLFAPVSSSSSNQLPQTKETKPKGKGRDRGGKRKFRKRTGLLRQVQNGHSVKSKRASKPVVNLARSLGTPPHDLEIEMEEKVNNDERERDADSSGSSNQPSDDTPSHSIGLTRTTGRIDYNWYGCILCAQDFRMLNGLKEHLVEWHNAKRSEVRCGKCGKEFGGCKTFHQHKHQVHKI